MKRLSLFAVALVLCSSVASAATVTFTLDNRVGGQWKLFAYSSAGDNTGIAGYSVEIAPGAATSLQHQSIRIAEVEANGGADAGPAGFSILRSPNNITTGLNVGGGQDNVSPTPFLIKGWGQTAGSFATAYPGATALSSVVGGTWEVEPAPPTGTPGNDYPGQPLGALVAQGNSSGQVRFLDVPTALTFANVFTGAGPEAAAATVQRQVLAIPEPASLALVGMSLLGFVAVRRRMA